MNTRTRRLVWSLAALALAACEGGPNPTDPAVEFTPTVTVNGVDLVLARSGRSAQPASAPVVGVIGAETGGWIETERGRLDVPAGALAVDTPITMQDHEVKASIRFGPSGLTFSVPARLAMSVDGAQVAAGDLERLRIAGASDLGDDWRIIGGVYDPATGRVVSDIEHFSQFALCLE